MGLAVRAFQTELWRGFESRLSRSGENNDLLGLYRTAALRTEFPDVRDALTVFDGSAPRFEPGTAFEYFSLGTVLLGASMGQASRLSFRDVMQEQVFQPLALIDTTAISGSDRAANFYFRAPDMQEDSGHQFREWRPVDLSHRLPGGGFLSMLSDLVRLGAAWLDNEFISTAVRTLFWTPQQLSSGEVNEQNYAIGWRWREWDIDGWGTVANANHGGVSRGAQCWLLVFPEHRLSIAFAINTRTDSFHDFGHALDEDLFRLFAPATR